MIVTSVYTSCIYTFYKYIYKTIWTNQHDQCLLKVVMYIIAFFLVVLFFFSLFWNHLGGFKLWPFGRNQPDPAGKPSWDWMSITGWRQLGRWTHCPLCSGTLHQKLDLPLSAELFAIFWTPTALVTPPPHPHPRGHRVVFVVNKWKMLWGCCFHWDVCFSRSTPRYLSWSF